MCLLNVYIVGVSPELTYTGMDTGRIDPRVESGRVEISEIHYVNFAVSVVFLIEIVMKKRCINSILAKLQ